MLERIVIFCSVLLVVFGLLFGWYVDRGSCYDKAMNYNTEVQQYSFLKNYCFVEISGNPVNLENYRDTLQINS